MSLAGPRIDLQLGGVWTDVSSFVATDEGITIRRGRSSETGSPENSSATLALINNDLRFSPRYPSGPYFGQFNRNTPIRIGVGIPPAGTSSQWAASGALTAPAVNAETSGTVLSAWAQNDSTSAITGPAGYTMSTGTTGASRAGLAVRSGYKTGVSAGTVAAVAATSTKTAAGAALSLFIPGATAVANAVPIMRVYNCQNPPQTWNGDTVTDTVSAGDVIVAICVWSDDGRNAMLQAPQDSSMHVDWMLVADSGASTGARIQAWVKACPVAETIKLHGIAEVYGQSDACINYYRLSGAAAYQARFAGYCSEITPGATSFGKDLRTGIVACSARSTFTQGAPAAQSPTYAYLTDRSPTVYWPLESGTQSMPFSSPVAGVGDITVVGATVGADTTSFPGSQALPTFPAGAYAYGLTGSTDTTAQISGNASCLVNVTTGGANGGFVFTCNLANDGTSASISAIGIEWVSVGFQLTVTLGDGTSSNMTMTNPSLHAATMVGVPCGIAMSWTAHSSTQTDVTFKCSPVDGSPEAPTAITVQTFSGKAGRVTKVTTGPIGGSGVMTVGHMAYANYGTVVDNANGALYPSTWAFTEMVRDWTREDVVLRLLRLAQLGSVPLSLPYITDGGSNFANQNVWHGPQTTDTLPNLFDLTQATDGGEMAEARGFAGLLYRPLAALCSQAVTQTFDYSAGYITAPFEPSDDVTLVRNDVTASQVQGASARATLATGALSTLQPPNGVGGYVTSVTVDSSQPSRDLPNVAAWSLALGTLDVERFKAVTSVLEAIPSSAAALMAVDIGQHVQTTNTPAWVQPGPADHLVIGTTEVIGALNEQSITYALRPFGTFSVWRLDSATFGTLNSGNTLGLNGGL